MERWFARRRKSKLLEMADRQMTLAIDTVIELEKSINAALKGKKEKATSSFKKLSVIEHEIDELRRIVFEELTRGSLMSKDREDIMHLVKRLDQMADHVKDASRAVVILLDAEVPKKMWEQFAETARELVVCATTLRNAIEQLGIDPMKAMELAKKIDEIEGIVDDKYLKSKAMMFFSFRLTRKKWTYSPINFAFPETGGMGLLWRILDLFLRSCESSRIRTHRTGNLHLRYNP